MNYHGKSGGLSRRSMIGGTAAVAAAALGSRVLAGSSDPHVEAEGAHEYLLRFGTDWDRYPLNTYPMSLLKYLELVVPERTGGRVGFKVTNVNHERNDAVHLLQQGKVEMTWGGNWVQPYSPVYRALLSLPFLMDGSAHFRRLMETKEFRAEQARLEDELGIRHVAVEALEGTTLFNNVRPIERIEDFKGLKIRIFPLPGYDAIFNELGMQAIRKENPEVVPSLRSGELDGAVCITLVVTYYELDKYAKYWLDYPIFMAYDEMSMNAPFWNSLPPDLQDTLGEILDEFFGRMFHHVELGMEKAGLDTYLATPGNVRTVPSQEFKEALRNAARPLHEAKKKESEEVRRILEAVERVR